VAELAGDRDVAATTLRIPHPYTREMAAEWIAETEQLRADGALVNFAITTEADGVIGSIGLRLVPEHRRAELGYWIGKPYWGKGYATEAGRAVVAHGFNDLGLHRIHAHFMTSNPASGGVLKKLGMTYEGTLRGHTFKWGEFFDIECYGVVRGAVNGER
jgi:RimJ/RimL family protein N-acetyltransferase